MFYIVSYLFLICSAAEETERGAQSRAKIESILSGERIASSKIADLRRRSMVRLSFA